MCEGLKWKLESRLLWKLKTDKTKKVGTGSGVYCGN
jgi:hypothetical protein